MAHELYDEASRQFVICNTCRYCEGFCAVFPAMENRTTFGKADISYLANICHDCRDCYYACPFIPPHEFAINIPEVLSRARLATYKEHTEPRFLAKALDKQKQFGGAVVAASLLLMVTVVAALGNISELVAPPGQDAIYALIPYFTLVVPGSILLAYILIAWARGMAGFWHEIHGAIGDLFDARALRSAFREAIGHKWFKGGGGGCDYPTNDGSSTRLYLHATVFFGFGLDVISTISAAIYQDVFGVQPPYGYATVPVAFGLVGGIMIVSGVSGLLYLKTKADGALTTKRMLDLDAVFLVLLELVALTGLATLALRYTNYMGLIFTLHMGFVLSLFITAPYGKFVHFVYRFLALAKRGFEESPRGMRRQSK